MCATNEGLYARVSSLTTPILRFEHIVYHETGPESRVFEVPMDNEILITTAHAGGFFSYVAGTAGVVLQHDKFKLKQQSAPSLAAGLYIHNHHTTLPMRKGLSSSAAVCVLVAMAFDRIYDIGFTQEELMELAFQVPQHNSTLGILYDTDFQFDQTGRDVDSLAVRAHGPVCGDGTRSRGSDEI